MTQMALYCTRPQIELMDRGEDGSPPAGSGSGDGPCISRLTHPRNPHSITVRGIRAFDFVVLLCFLSFSAFAQNRVLQLDGTNSFVELPAGAFTNLDEVTVEGWVKWEGFENMSRFFD